MKKVITLIVFCWSIIPMCIIAQPSMSEKVEKNSSTDLLPKRIIAGFLDVRTPGSTSRVDIDKAKNDGYNVIIIAYGEVYGTDIGFYTSSPTSIQTIIDKVRQAKEAGMKVLLAVGGIPNTFHPGVSKTDATPNIFGKDMPNAQISALANNIVNFLHKNSIDGIVYSFRKFTSSDFINQLSLDIKKLDPKIAIVAEPQVSDYKLVTTGKSNDYDKVIQNGYIDYLFIQEYDTYPEYEPGFIADSYSKIVNDLHIPIHTKILIGEPTNAVSGGTNTIYHPEGNATLSLTTEQAVELMLPEFEKLKFKPRFAGVTGWSLNTDYAADLYGDSSHNSGVFAKNLRKCIYDNFCVQVDSKIKGPVIAGFLPLWGKSSSYNISGRRINTTPVDISMPKNKEYCDQNPDVCKYNVIIAAYVTHTSSKGFELSFNNENGSSNKLYDTKELKEFINYMGLKGKHVLISFGGKSSHIDWQTVNFDSLISIVKEFGFNGINFDLPKTAIPKNEKQAQTAALKINRLITSLRSNDKDFWLTFSPEWDYIVAPLAKNDKDNMYVDHGYVELLDNIDISKINYIFLNTFSERPADAILGFYKDQKGEFIKVSPLDGYDKFLASLAWAITTPQGFEVNYPKYEVDKPIKIPANKLVFVVPATKGAAHGGDTYVLSSSEIRQMLSLMKENKASFAGFALWSMDFDATNIGLEDLSDGYQHLPWSSTNDIASIELPPVASIVNDSDRYLKNVNASYKPQKYIMDTGIVRYPYQIGTYGSDTVVSFAGKMYKCKSMLEIKLCNDEAYIPNGLYGDLAWEELKPQSTKKVLKKKKYILKEGEVVTYPKGIGGYKFGQIVIADGREFECQKEEYCNNSSYSPMKEKGFLAWSNITNDISHFANEEQDIKFSGADYIYPYSIEDYKGGTVVAVDKDLYRCNIGPESSLCTMSAYKPTGKYGTDAWTKISNK
ncbi:glycosyl hydrolase family 18 protein [Francisella philomiragia]|uniref:Glycosyl hydrolases 18 family protein n=1 Tax=Francisella philomiragia TaxID=28110 RepID=A0A0B6D3Q9_9GAMM|nr:glycosyl hydrolase family 18 protein [Francisella philomiragia]AJI52917.1 glycosyl hydrolases 18 family protein [Francisella philomiragia]